MNNRQMLVILFIVLLPSTVFGIPIFNQIKCANSPDGKAQVINNVLKCDLEALFYDQDFWIKQSFDIIKEIVFYSNIRLDVSPLMLMKILGENTIRLPSHLAYLKIIIKDGTDKEQILVISMTLKIFLRKTGGLCDFNFVDFKPNISDFNSPLLPEWLSKGIEKIINNNQRLRREILKLANTSAVQARKELGLCQK
jgi:hypothetical protein